MRLNRQVQLENLAAELTEAAFPVALRQGMTANWLENKLELWNTLRQTVEQWEQRSSLVFSK